jgi:hypothetical protein
VEVPVPETLAGLTEQDRPLGEEDVDNETVPAKPFAAVTVITDVPEAPELIVTLVGFAESEKSPKLNVAVAG